MMQCHRGELAECSRTAESVNIVKMSPIQRERQAAPFHEGIVHHGFTSAGIPRALCRRVCCSKRCCGNSIARPFACVASHARAGYLHHGVRHTAWHCPLCRGSVCQSGSSHVRARCCRIATGTYTRATSLLMCVGVRGYLMQEQEASNNSAASWSGNEAEFTEGEEMVSWAMWRNRSVHGVTMWRSWLTDCQPCPDYPADREWRAPCFVLCVQGVSCMVLFVVLCANRCPTARWHS